MNTSLFCIWSYHFRRNERTRHLVSAADIDRAKSEVSDALGDGWTSTRAEFVCHVAGPDRVFKEI